MACVDAALAAAATDFMNARRLRLCFKTVSPRFSLALFFRKGKNEIFAARAAAPQMDRQRILTDRVDLLLGENEYHSFVPRAAPGCHSRTLQCLDSNIAFCQMLLTRNHLSLSPNKKTASLGSGGYAPEVFSLWADWCGLCRR